MAEGERGRTPAALELFAGVAARPARHHVETSVSLGYPFESQPGPAVSAHSPTRFFRSPRSGRIPGERPDRVPRALRHREGVMSNKRTYLAVLAVAACAGRTYAADPWENLNDDSSITVNLMRHGDRQTHDLEGAPPAYDQDWIRVVTQARHSYEARVTGNYWDLGCTASGCPQLARVNSGGTVLDPGFATADDVPNAAVFFSLGQTVRWTPLTDAADFLRVRGDQLVPLGARPYTVLFRDTTLLVPRWNSSGTQTTVFVIQNGQRDTVTGSLHLYNGSGTLLDSVGLSVPPYGVQVFSTSALPGLAGQSGSAQITHNGGYGGLTGKAVALEPSTGFVFDTVITPIPY